MPHFYWWVYSLSTTPLTRKAVLKDLIFKHFYYFRISSSSFVIYSFETLLRPQTNSKCKTTENKNLPWERHDIGESFSFSSENFQNGLKKQDRDAIRAVIDKKTTKTPPPQPNLFWKIVFQCESTFNAAAN